MDLHFSETLHLVQFSTRWDLLRERKARTSFVESTIFHRKASKLGKARSAIAASRGFLGTATVLRKVQLERLRTRRVYVALPARTAVHQWALLPIVASLLFVVYVRAAGDAVSGATKAVLAILVAAATKATIPETGPVVAALAVFMWG